MARPTSSSPAAACPAPLVFATFLAANIGAGSTIGASSLGYSLGLGGWWWNASAGLGSLVFALWAGPRLWRLARDRNFLTLGDYLEWRYNSAVRATVSLIIWCISLAILAGQLLGATSILQVVAGVPRWAGAVTAAIVVVIYFVAGGLLTSAWVNLVQLVVKLTGFLIALPLALSAAGGWAGLSAPGTPQSFLDPLGHSGSALWFLPLLAPAFLVSPGLVQKAYGAVDARAVRLGVGLNAIALMLFAIVPVALGMVARVRHPGARVAGSGAADAPRARSAACGGRADAGGHLRRGDERGRRGAVHAVDVVLAGPLSSLPQTRGE